MAKQNRVAVTRDMIMAEGRLPDGQWKFMARTRIAGLYEIDRVKTVYFMVELNYYRVSKTKE